MWCEPEFHRAGHGKMFMENKENESLKISAKLVDLEDAEEFLKKSAIGKEKIRIAAGDKKSEKVSMEVPVAEKSENFQAREDNCEELNLQDYQLELENRIRNLLWTISGDYTQQMKPDVSLFLRSKDIALYDGIKQGALAKFFDKDFLGMYLVKKIFMGADEAALTFVSQLCIEEAIGERICEQRPGIWEMQRKACEDILDQEYETMPSAADKLGYLRVNLLRRRIDRGENADASNKTLTNITEKEQYFYCSFSVIDFKLRTKWNGISQVFRTSVCRRTLISRERFSVRFALNKILLHFGRNAFKEIPKIP